MIQNLLKIHLKLAYTRKIPWFILIHGYYGNQAFLVMGWWYMVGDGRSPLVL